MCSHFEQKLPFLVPFKCCIGCWPQGDCKKHQEKLEGGLYQIYTHHIIFFRIFIETSISSLTSTWVWEKTPLRGSWPSASWRRRWTWTWRPPGGCRCWKACCTVKLFALQVFEEKVGQWKKEWSSTHWRWARRVQAGEEEDIRAGHRLPVVP